jgi:hypothetical protein
MTMFISFILLVLTSIILYIVPHGRVAYWADWHLWGLTKTQWGNLHINLGFLFLFAGLLHMYYNWAVITAYMKNRAREIKVFTPSFNVALLLTVIVGVGTYFEVPPMSSVINLGESIKNAASEKYGEPPYGHAELSSLKLFAKKQGLDLNQAVDLLKKADIQFNDSKDTLATIAKVNKLSPQEVYTIIKPAAANQTAEGTISFPDSPMTGFGNKTIAEVCSEFNLMFRDIQRGLAKKGVKVEAEMTIKEIAAANDKDPMAIFEDIHGLVYENQDM